MAVFFIEYIQPRPVSLVILSPFHFISAIKNTHLILFNNYNWHINIKKNMKFKIKIILKKKSVILISFHFWYSLLIYLIIIDIKKYEIKN